MCASAHEDADGVEAHVEPGFFENNSRATQIIAIKKWLIGDFTGKNEAHKRDFINIYKGIWMFPGT